jgi:uncharacterized damage-inducible protein DinB
MSFPELAGKELLAWVEQTSQGWLRLVRAHPKALSIPCDIRETQSAGELLQHIVAVELRYAERLHGLPETPYQAIPFATADELYGTHDRAMKLLLELEDQGEEYWLESLTFVTRSGGTMRASRRNIFTHALLHSIRHYAQLATLVRQHGIAPDWPMDYLFLRQPEAG